MRKFVVRQASCLKGEISLLGDKSIAHRSIIISSLTRGRTIIENFPTNRDCLSTVSAFKKMGIKIKSASRKMPVGSRALAVFGKGMHGLSRPKAALFVGDSGTTLRLLLGVLSGQNLKITLTGGESLSRRPMLRVTAPLRKMGAKISAKSKLGGAKEKEEYPPIIIQGGKLRSIGYRLPVASAQVKSAILLAGLYASSVTCVTEPMLTRDHTERMLRAFQADIKVKANKILIRGGKELISPRRVYIPGDISSASFFIVAAAILGNSRLLVKNVSLNPRRFGIIRILKRMGADIKVIRSICKRATGNEPIGDIVVKSSKLKGVVVKSNVVPSLIDELPILMVAACFAEGKTIIEGAQELRVKETDRIYSMFSGLKEMGAKIRISKVGKSERIIIEGVKSLAGARVRTFGDHRTAMSMIVAGLRARGKTIVDDISCINKSFPEFIRNLNKISA